MPSIAAPNSAGPRTELQLVPALLCVYGAGAVASIAAALWLGALRGVGSSELPFALAQAVLAAGVGAVALRMLLPQVTGFAVSLRSAFVALAGGAIVSAAAGLLAPRPSAPPVTVALSLAAWLAGALIAVRVLQASATQVAPDTSSAQQSDMLAATMIAADPPAERDDRATAARGACETALALVAAVERSAPADVATAVLDGLPLLQAAIEHLARLQPADTDLLAALRRVVDELVAQANDPVPGGVDLSGSPAAAALRTALRALDPA